MVGKKLKRIVRGRMALTGESYTTALRRVQEAGSKREPNAPDGRRRHHRRVNQAEPSSQGKRAVEMSIEDEIEKIEEFDRVWKTLPDMLVSEALNGKLAPSTWSPDLVEKLIRHTVARCFDLHVSQMADFSLTPEE